jgi:hypothetical protein
MQNMPNIFDALYTPCIRASPRWDPSGVQQGNVGGITQVRTMNVVVHTQ